MVALVQRIADHTAHQAAANEATEKAIVGGVPDCHARAEVSVGRAFALIRNPARLARERSRGRAGCGAIWRQTLVLCSPEKPWEFGSANGAIGHSFPQGTLQIARACIWTSIWMTEYYSTFY